MSSPKSNDLQQSVAGLSTADKGLVFAIATIADRISGLKKADKDDMMLLVKALIQSECDDDRIACHAAMMEILSPERPTVLRADLVDKDAAPTPKKWAEFVASLVRQARTTAGISQDELAKRSGLPQSHISRIETGKHSPSMTTVKKVADALGIPLSQFTDAE